MWGIRPNQNRWRHQTLETYEALVVGQLLDATLLGGLCKCQAHLCRHLSLHGVTI